MYIPVGKRTNISEFFLELLDDSLDCVLSAWRLAALSMMISKGHCVTEESLHELLI